MNRIAEQIGNNPDRFRELVDLLLSNESRLIQRAAWVTGLLAERYPALLLPHLETLLERSQDRKAPAALRRNVARALRWCTPPEDLHGQILNQCFEWLADPAETIAVRCFSMEILDTLSRQYPDIRPELYSIIEDALLLQQPTAGFRSRARKVLAGRKK